MFEYKTKTKPSKTLLPTHTVVKYCVLSSNIPVKYCVFDVLKDQLIRDRIVVGLKNKKLSEKLQLDLELTLEKAMAQARQNEEIKKKQSIIHGNKYTGSYEHNNIDNISKNRKQTRQTQMFAVSRTSAFQTILPCK